MSKYARLTLPARQVIQNMNGLGFRQIDIALAVGADQSTISRGLRRLKGPYDAKKAQSQARELASVPVNVPLLDRCAELVGHLSHYLHRRYSIGQALALTSRKYPTLASISAQAVYDWLYSSDVPIKKALRKLMIRPRSRRRPRRKPESRRGEIKNMTPIADRPGGAQDRSEFGHWEGDLVVGAGGKSAVATMVERVTRLTVIIKVASRKSATVIAALARRMRPYEIGSITWDQGQELALHERLSALLGVSIYFADAHSPWQRGSNENTNGVLRRHLPKGTSFDVHPAKLRTIQNLLDGRPMQALSGATPKEAYDHQLALMAGMH